MTDTNTKKRKKMIKEMKKGVYRFREDGVVSADSKGTIQRVRGFKKDDLANIFTMKLKDYKYKPSKIIRPEPKEMNFIQALIMLIIVFILFTAIFPLIQRAVDIQALQTCEAYGDCSEVIRDINK